MTVQNLNGTINNSFTIGKGNNKITIDTTENGEIVLSILKVDGVVTKVDEINSNTTLTSSHHTIICNPTENITITLPSVTNIIGQEYIISNISNKNITIVPDGGNTIIGQSNYIINTQWTTIKIKAYSSGWIVI